MKRFLSRYHWRYPRSLVYMLQTSEYHLREYWRWLSRVQNFSQVEHRKQLVKTAKAKLLLAGILVFNILFILLLLLLFLSALPVAVKILGGLVLIIIWPQVLPYLVCVPLFLADTFIKKPYQWRLARHTRKRLTSHSAVKIAIAGSYGKTTLREILATVLGVGKKVARPPLSYNTTLGIAKFVAKLDGDEEVIVFEYGEYKPNDIRHFSKLTQPDIGILTGINEAHLSQFKNIKTTEQNFRHLVNYLQEKPLYVNAENERAKQVGGGKALTYSRQGADGWKVSSAKTDMSGTSFIARKGSQVVVAKSQLLGLHQIGPLVASIAIAERLGLNPAQIAKGIGRTKPFEHRLQPKPLGDGITLIDDTYNANPDGIKAGLSFMHSLKADRKLYITPGLVEAGPQAPKLHQQLGKAIAKVADIVILIKTSVSPYIAEGLSAAGFKGEVLWFNDALDCMAALPQLTKHGDVVLWQNDWPDNYA